MVALKKGLDRILGWALVIIMAVAVVNVLWQVFTRFVMNDPSSFTDELARYLLIWIGILGAAFATGNRSHLAIDLIGERVSGAADNKMMLIVEAVIFAFGLFIMLVGGANLVSLTFLLGQTSPALGIPLGYVYLVIPLAGLLIMYYSLTFLLERLRVMRGEPSRIPEIPDIASEGPAN